MEPLHAAALNALRIDIDADSRDLRDVVAEVAQKTALDIRLAEGVTATATVRGKGLPWRDVLDGLAREHGLRVMQDGLTTAVTLVKDAPAAPRSPR